MEQIELSFEQLGLAECLDFSRKSSRTAKSSNLKGKEGQERLGEEWFLQVLFAFVIYLSGNFAGL